MTTWVLRRGRGCPLPVPKRRRFGDFRPPDSCPPGPSSPFLLKGPFFWPSPRPPRMLPLGHPPFPPSFFPGHRPRRVACETVDGPFCHGGRLGEAPGAPVPDPGGSSFFREGGGQGSYLYRRFLSSPRTPSKQPAFLRRPLWMLWPPYWLSLFWVGAASRVWRNQDARWLSRGPEPVALEKAGLDPRSVESGYHQWTGVLLRPGLRPRFSPGPLGFPRVGVISFSGCPGFLPRTSRGGATGEGGVFRRDFQERQTRSLFGLFCCLSSVTGGTAPPSPVGIHSPPPQFPRSDVVGLCRPPVSFFRPPSLLPTVRPAFDRAVTPPWLFGARPFGAPWS
ncbi:hypothetical protein GWK47_027176 [Chionoecetes opilio]|uniref:Uncharacterized protein n=1 Tax=Chionoecetes opilio TaxID=41210 RepID=A0A8J8W9P7_CHIOP|nr:hypothetical protein GWK47_027176 [Chionoecetes opilio]